MSLWSFGRKGDRKRPRSGAFSDMDTPGAVESIAAPVDTAAAASAPGPHVSTPASPNPNPMSMPRPPASKKRRTNSTSPTSKLIRRPRGQSFSSQDASTHRVRQATFATPTPDPSTDVDIDVRMTDGNDDEIYRVPTLHRRRNSTRTLQKSRQRNSRRGRKSAGPEAASHDTTINVPCRPATETWQSGRLIKKDSIRVKSGFGFRNPQCSTITLPTRDSIHSCLSSDSEHDFKVSTLGSLSPQPTLRCSGPSYQPAPVSRAPSSKRKTLSMPISAQTLKAHKRVDSLADNLDASELRELMERDKRRRKRKRQRDREHLELRLSERAAAQREEEERSRRTGQSPPRNSDRGVFGRELEGLRAPSQVWAPRRHSDTSVDDAHIPRCSFQEERTAADINPPPETQTQQAEEMVVETPPPPQPTPSEWEGPTMLSHELESQQRHQQPEGSVASRGRVARPSTEDVAMPPPPPPVEVQPLSEPLQVEETDQILSPPISPAVVGALKRKQSASRSSLVSEQGKFTVVKPRRLGDESAPPSASAEAAKPERKRSLKKVLSALFRWPSRTKKATAPAPSFSITSREEMMAAALRMQSRNQTLGLSQSQETMAVGRVASGMPKRTLSRFKEDLPEHPMSPPPSRLQSPDAAADTDTRYVKTDDASLHDRLFVQQQATPRLGTPASGHRSMLDTVRNTPVSWRNQTSSAEPPMSESFASVDSEASWFSGRMGGSSKSPAASRSISRATYNQASNYSLESLPHGESEELSTLSRHDSNTTVREPVEQQGQGRPSSDEDETMNEGDDTMIEEGNARLCAVEARQQTRVIPARQGRAIQSCQGLVVGGSLNEGDNFEVDVSSGADADAASDTRRSIGSTGSVILSRARSIIFGKGQPRPISIKSTKLLDATPNSTEERRSGDSRRSTSSVP